MLDTVKQFFHEHIGAGDESQQGSQRQLQLATAALLLEMAQADNARHSTEFQAIHEGVQETFQLSPSETSELIELADQQAHEATDDFEFTQLINEQFDYPRKCRVIELLWRVCLSDQDMDRYEEQLARKIAELLHVEHKDFIAAKLKVQRDLSTRYIDDYEDYE